MFLCVFLEQTLKNLAITAIHDKKIKIAPIPIAFALDEQAVEIVRFGPFIAFKIPIQLETEFGDILGTLLGSTDLGPLSTSC